MRDHLGQNLIGSDLGFARGILLLDDCDGGFLWEITGAAGDAVHDVNGVAAFRGSGGLRLITRTAGAAIGDGMTISRRVSFSESGLLVYRLRICFPDVSRMGTVPLEVYVEIGGHEYLAALLWRPKTPDVRYMNDLGGFTAIPALAFGVSDGAWTMWEMVLDVAAFRYLSVSLGGVHVDMGGVGLLDAGATAPRQIGVWLGFETAVNAPATVYVDDVYVGEFVDV